MNASGFDRWTRRRFGHVAGSAAAAFVGLPAAIGARKKCKKIRCQKLLQTCQPDSARQGCCQGLNCDPVDGQGTLLLCCLGRQQRCQTSSQCCGKTICFSISGLPDARCCGAGGQFCASTLDCCSGYECSGNSCAAISDRELKANFATVDSAAIVWRVRELPISSWNFTFDDPTVRHVGRMAQDFAATFGVAADNRHIHPIDELGVALAAIQGVAREVAVLRDENASLAVRLGELETGDWRRALVHRDKETA